MQGSYDDLPKYDWDASFDLKAYAAKIEDHNNEIFGRVKDRLLDAAGLNMYNHPPMICK